MILFNKKSAGHYQSGVSKGRSIVKSFTWRALGTLDTIVISYILTGEMKTAASIGGIEIFTKIFLYFFHERIWNYIKWGKKVIKIPEQENAK